MLGSLRDLAERAGLGRVPTTVFAAITVICLAVAAWGFARWVPPDSGGDVPGPVMSQSPAVVPTSSPSASLETTEAESPICIHLVGAVLRPGVYRVSRGDRVVDALELAGGLLGNAAERGVNLARPVVDGEQVYVPTQDEWSACTEAAARDPVAGGASPPPASSVAPEGPMNVNTANASQLEELPGIGPATAAKIVADREANGPFGSVDELLRVSGIGEAKLAAIRDLVCVD